HGMLQIIKHNIFFFFQAEDGIRDFHVTGVQTCALPIFSRTEWVEENRDVVVRAAAAMLAANRYITDPANRDQVIEAAAQVTERRSEERRVGKEKRSRRTP